MPESCKGPLLGTTLVQESLPPVLKKPVGWQPGGLSAPESSGWPLMLPLLSGIMQLAQAMSSSHDGRQDGSNKQKAAWQQQHTLMHTAVSIVKHRRCIFSSLSGRL